MNESEKRPPLSQENALKISRISNEMNLSETEVVNRIIESVTEIEIRQIVSFKVEVRREGVKPQFVTMRRMKNWDIKL